MSLPPIKGKYKISTSAWRAPIAKRTFGEAKLKSSKFPAFQSEEISVQMFYPCDPPKKARFGEAWLEQPRAQWTDGYAKFLGISRWLLYPLVLLLGRILKIPTYVGVPLKQAPEGQWPLIIFSHGLAGTKRTYSQICGKLAADGFIVIAMEHRDGTAPACTYPLDGEISTHFYIKVEDLDWDDKLSKPSTPMPLRTQQLEIRYIEVLEAFKTFKALISGNETAFIDKSYLHWDSWKNQVNTDTMTFVGHSFGGCTALHVLTHPAPPQYEALPIAKAILHDPWMEPIPLEFEDNVIENKTSFSIPIITINSEEFTVWKEHRARQEKLLEPWIKQAGADSAFVTLAKSKHMSFSDIPVFSPFKKIPMALQEDMHQMSLAFVNGQLQPFLKSINNRVTNNLEVEFPDDNKRKRIVANTGDVIIHYLSTEPS